MIFFVKNFQALYLGWKNRILHLKTRFQALWLGVLFNFFDARDRNRSWKECINAHYRQGDPEVKGAVSISKTHKYSENSIFKLNK